MRPTLLNYRSPKERTPFFFESRKTYDGRSLSFNSPKGSYKTSSFSQEKRFNWYKKLQGTSYPAGPGTYSPLGTRVGSTRVSSVLPYRKLYGLDGNSSKGYEMVGNQIVQDFEFFSKMKNTQNGSDPKLSTNQDSQNNSNTSTMKKTTTPEPILRHYLKANQKKAKKSSFRTTKKFKIFSKIEKIMKARMIIK